MMSSTWRNLSIVVFLERMYHECSVTHTGVYENSRLQGRSSRVRLLRPAPGFNSEPVEQELGIATLISEYRNLFKMVYERSLN